MSAINDGIPYVPLKVSRLVPEDLAPIDDLEPVKSAYADFPNYHGMTGVPIINNRPGSYTGGYGKVEIIGGSGGSSSTNWAAGAGGSITLTTGRGGSAGSNITWTSGSSNAWVPWRDYNDDEHNIDWIGSSIKVGDYVETPNGNGIVRVIDEEMYCVEIEAAKEDVLYEFNLEEITKCER